MVALDEDAIICDFAEYYHVLEAGSLPVWKQAVLACGLPRQSRIMKKIANVDIDPDTLLLAAILDQERIANWMHTKDARRKQNFPKSIVEAMSPKAGRGKEEVQAFESGEAFKARYEKLAGRG